MTFSGLSDHRKGLLLTTIGGLALSMDIPLVRLSDGSMWSILAARSFTTFAATLLIIVILRRFTSARPVLMPGRIGLIVGFLYGLSTLTFLAAVFNTATANVVFILAFNPMFGALLSWAFLRERPRPATLLTMLVMVIGVGLIVSDGMSRGGIFGDAMACLSAFVLATALTIGRASRRDMGFVPLVTTIFPAVIGLAMAIPNGIAIAHPFWIVFNGAVMMPVAFWCLAAGPRYLSAPEVGMFYLLETILAPLWVWLIFSEAPSRMALAGGGLMIVALIVHSLWQARKNAIVIAPIG